MPRMKGRGRP